MGEAARKLQRVPRGEWQREGGERKNYVKEKKNTPPKQQMPAGGRHSADPPLLTWGDVTLRPSDMDLLAPGQWLNDQVGRGER